MSTNSFVKILIKAPNQLVDDQTVLCERSWTVKRLKSHLSKVYPCKPQPEKQKLIYSGQLLSDDAVLSEVLRSYDGLENNTIHLVCSVRDSYKLNRQVPKTAQQQQRQPQQQNSLPRESNNAFRGEELPQIQNPNLRHTGPIVFPPMANSSLSMAQQNVLFQQAYFNYMANISQMYLVGNRFGTLETTPESISQTVVGNQENENVNEDTPANDRIEEEVEEGREEVRGNRDWLEWFYILSRLFVLFTVVYFYSSPERFIVVIVMALIIINIDVLRWLRGNNPVEVQAPPTDVNPAVVLENRVEHVEQQPNWFNVTLTFMKTFLLSLVPDNREI